MKKILLVSAALLTAMNAHAGKTFTNEVCAGYATFAKCNDITLRHANSCTWDTAASKCVATAQSSTTTTETTTTTKGGGKK